jgi:hypothetical protein
MWLVFVDTNILLDLYRQGGESAERQLTALERHKESLIVGEQVRMEYLKNRQKVIVEGQKNVKNPDRPFVPPILSAYQPAKTWKKTHEKALKQSKKVQAKIDLILRDPLHHDRVFQALIRIFKHKSPFNLTEGHEKMLLIRGRARKRFLLGYPPRKNADNSIGDAINWEWIIHCAQEAQGKPDILIVSRDSDFGMLCGTEAVLNDWLKREFQERVSKKRKIELTNKLTFALQKLAEPVQQVDVEEEEKIIQEGSPLTDRLREMLTGTEDPAMREAIDRLVAAVRGVESPTT